MEQIDFIELKNKFSDYISKLYTNNNISLECINNTIIENDIFDFMENNKTNEFLSYSYEEFVYKLYKINSIYLKNETISEIIWASKMYITLSLNLNVPLKTTVLLCPLKQMIELFPAFHEMNDTQTIDYFKQNILKISILKELKKLRNISTKELSIITGININTLNSYEKNNEHLFNANFDNISKIKKALNVSYSFFKKESDFIPFNYVLFKNDKIKNYLLSFFNEYYKKSLNIKETYPILVLSNNKKTYCIDDELLKIAYKKAINKYLINNKELLF